MSAANYILVGKRPAGREPPVDDLLMAWAGLLIIPQRAPGLNSGMKFSLLNPLFSDRFRATNAACSARLGGPTSCSASVRRCVTTTRFLSPLMITARNIARSPLRSMRRIISSQTLARYCRITAPRHGPTSYCVREAAAPPAGCRRAPPRYISLIYSVYHLRDARRARCRLAAVAGLRRREDLAADPDEELVAAAVRPDHGVRAGQEKFFRVQRL